MCMHLLAAKTGGHSAACIFGDLRNAFYSSMPEIRVGPLMSRNERAELMATVGFQDEHIVQMSHLLDRGGLVLQESRVPCDLLAALNSWHMATSFNFRIRKPRDTVADVIFACAVAQFH